MKKIILAFLIIATLVQPAIALKVKTHSLDREGDGILDVINKAYMDTAGRVIIQTYDNNADGVVESTHTTSYDANGYSFSSETRESGTNRLLRTRSQTNDATDRPLTISSDTDGNGAVDRVATYVYGGAGYDNYSVTTTTGTSTQIETHSTSDQP
ncbi:MAG: hypothetical protein WC799_10225 [Desulfobacteraceae bacterium]|jgi:hypothetical protein